MKTVFLDEIRGAMGATAGAGLPGVRVHGVNTDSRTVGEGELFFAIKGERFDGHEFLANALSRGATAAVVSHVPEGLAEAFRGRLLVVDDPVRALGRLAGHYRDQLTATVIAVTGSNGKTTTKEMIHHVLGKHFAGRRSPKSFNNQIGVPLTLLSAEPGDKFLVAEAGTNHPGELDGLASIIRPDVAVITLVAESHLEGFGSLEGVAVEKSSLAKHVRPGGAAIINGDCELLTRLVAETGTSAGQTLVRFGYADRNDLRIAHVESDASAVRFTVNGRFAFVVPVPGRHNAMNALAAVAAARRMGLSMERIAEDLADFVLPTMRLEVERMGAVTVVNDAYNANPASMQAALETLEDLAGPDGRGRLVFFCGDMLELGAASEAYHRKLGRRVGSGKVSALVTVGAMSRFTAEEAVSAGLARSAVRSVGSAAEAKGLVGEVVRAGDVVLVKGSRSVGMEAVVEGIREMSGKTTKCK